MTEISVNKRVQQRGTQICHWCTKEMSEAAKNCHHCGKLRIDIRRDKMRAYQFFACAIILTALFLVLCPHMSGWVQRPEGLYSFGREKFSIVKFLSSLSGFFLSVSFLIVSVGAIYYERKADKKMHVTGQ